MIYRTISFAGNVNLYLQFPFYIFSSGSFRSAAQYRASDNADARQAWKWDHIDMPSDQ